MELVRKLKAALAAVPVSQPCTAAAVAALSIGAHDLAEELQHMFSVRTPLQFESSPVVDACAWQQLPSACMPVLAWLADGLDSGLPPAAQQQALYMSCFLLMVVSLVIPISLEARVRQREQSAKGTALRLLGTLGAFEDMCKQLAAVARAVVGAVFPAWITTTAATSANTSSGSGSSSSNQAAEPLQMANMAMAWLRTGLLLETSVVVHSPNSLSASVPTVTRALTGSGLYQVLLEGVLLLLGLDPAAYSQALDTQVELSGILKTAVRTAIILGGRPLGIPVMNVWYDDTLPRGKAGSFVILPPTHNLFEPWMRPLFQLQMLLLAKMQWDVRHGPSHTAQPQHPDALPAKPLARALRHMVSPCVAGDLLQQRAPGLVPHGYQARTPVVFGQGQVVEGVRKVPFDVIAARDFSDMLIVPCRPLRACIQDECVFDTLGVLDVALILEVSELYCLVCPLDRVDAVRKDPFLTLQQAVQVAPHSVRAEFAATYGEALLSIAECLVEDVLLVSSGGSSSSAPAAAPDSRPVTGTSQHRTPETQHNSSTSSSSSSSGRRRPWAGGRNPAVTLVNHRVWWAQDTVSTIGRLMLQDYKDYVVPIDAGESAEPRGVVTGIMQSLFSPTNAPRVSRLLEVVLRTPELQGPRLQPLMSLLPRRLPLLHVAASSPEGSRALLSAATSAAKAQQVGLVVMSALVQSQGELLPAAAGVAAAVPGRMGQAIAQQLLQQPDALVSQAVNGGLKLAHLGMDLMARAAALLDPVLAPAAAYLAARKLPPGQDSKPWAVEAALSRLHLTVGEVTVMFDYHGLLVTDSPHMLGIMRELAAALSLQQSAAVSKQAAGLVKKAGGGAAEVEQLRQQLQGMWLGDVPAEPGGDEQQQVAASGALDLTSSALAAAAVSSSSSGLGAAHDASQLPDILQRCCEWGLLQEGEVLAAGDPTRWSTALGPTSEADLRVASTALLAACKAAGAVAQLPVLVEQLQGIMAQQSWAQETAGELNAADVTASCGLVADWALLLAPLLAVLLPAQQAAELMEAAAGTPRDDSTNRAQLTPATSAHVLGLLGHVVAPGAPGCSYPGCCNLEGRSEAELSTQVCSKCRGARYCCREHQVAHWKVGHKEVCQAAQAAVQQVRLGTASGGV